VLPDAWVAAAENKLAQEEEARARAQYIATHLIPFATRYVSHFAAGVVAEAADEEQTTLKIARGVGRVGQYVPFSPAAGATTPFASVPDSAINWLNRFQARADQKDVAYYYGVATAIVAGAVIGDGEGLLTSGGERAAGAAAKGVASDANVVYRSVSAAGDVQYAGLTNDLARRAAEHLAGKGIQIEKIMGGLSRADARSVEQALIEIHGLGKNGGSLLNKINSIARSNPEYAAMVQRGYELLWTIGYR
jgi:hypothetical protein